MKPKLNRYKSDVFSGLGCAKNFEYNLSLKTNADLSKVKSRRLRFNPRLNDEMESQVKTMLDADVIKLSDTDVLLPVVLAKKHDGSMRFCLDLRSLNKQLEDETYPLMTTQEAMMQLKNSKYFSVNDMCSAFNQIPLSKDSRHLTGFQTTSGVYQFTGLCFGLKVAPLAFQKIMHLVIGDLGFTNIIMYLDDCLIHTASVDEHFETL
ncbi:hypothetical protein SNE40_008556 [Patella caerulea]|uniref:Reverse transcriptase domain-containing protein n=1 Tax=Patella caerulea TaxID=87958 RepID=A0AAN8Q3T5_PATCE